jgi:peptidoglycan hydrolase-like protein with peptidoglycan-binding domain
MNSGPTLSLGSTGTDVRRLQRILVMIKLLDYTGIDGNFGAQTESAVKSFQQSNGLTVDGIVGPLTWQALPADPDTPELSNGSSGSEVSALQQALQNAGCNPGAIDGQFGPNTENAVKTYQTQRGVTADGVVGDQTWWVPAGAAGATLASLAGLTTA